MRASMPRVTSPSNGSRRKTFTPYGTGVNFIRVSIDPLAAVIGSALPPNGRGLTTSLGPFGTER
jgi:hypothetical protein